MAVGEMPGSKPAKPEEKKGRERLVAEAVQLLSSEGIHGTSIGKLAERTGYSKGGIMAHFNSKREMVLTLIDESVAITRAYFREELKGATTPSQRLSRTLETYGTYWTSGVFEGGCLFLNLSVDATEASDEISLALKTAARTFISDFANIVRIGQATDEFRADADADDVGERLMALCIGCGWIYRMTGEDQIFQRMQPAVDEILTEILKKARVTH
ncbi:MAG: TetR/AcrR family transcriptional regulator [Gemmatimonadetes bacterium]|nr:TetR/AcrR family transcriptional regulator [Gemmatimonadota bacterium]